MPDSSDALATLRTLTGPDQAKAVAVECTVLSRRVDQLRAGNAEHMSRIGEAEGRIDAAQLAISQALDAIEDNMKVWEATLDRHEKLLDMRESA